MPSSPEARPWLLAATALGLGHAAISLVWVLGGTWLVGTIGGQIEDWGRDGDLGVRLALLVVVGAKIAAVGLVWLAVRRGVRIHRILGWLTGALLTAYGGLLSVVGLLVVHDVITASADADLHALQWHAYFWDPWFLLWGVAALAALWLSRSRRAH